MFLSFFPPSTDGLETLACLKKDQGEEEQEEGKNLADLKIISLKLLLMLIGLQVKNQILLLWSVLSLISPLVSDMLESTTAGFGVERPLVGVQIRRTDKVYSSRNPTNNQR